MEKMLKVFKKENQNVEQCLKKRKESFDDELIHHHSTNKNIRDDTKEKPLDESLLSKDCNDETRTRHIESLLRKKKKLLTKMHKVKNSIDRYLKPEMIAKFCGLPLAAQTWMENLALQTESSWGFSFGTQTIEGYMVRWRVTLRLPGCPLEYFSAMEFEASVCGPPEIFNVKMISGDFEPMNRPRISDKKIVYGRTEQENRVYWLTGPMAGFFVPVGPLVSQSLPPSSSLAPESNNRLMDCLFEEVFDEPSDDPAGEETMFKNDSAKTFLPKKPSQGIENNFEDPECEEKLWEVVDLMINEPFGWHHHRHHHHHGKPVKNVTDEEWKQIEVWGLASRVIIHRVLGRLLHDSRCGIMWENFFCGCFCEK